MPRGVTWEEAASVPLNALGAWQASFVYAGLGAPRKEGGESAGRKRVLVTAAGNGVRVWAVQPARAVRAEVVKTCGPANERFVRGLGADEVLDYKVTVLKGWGGAEEGGDSMLC